MYNPLIPRTDRIRHAMLGEMMERGGWSQDESNASEVQDLAKAASCTMKDAEFHVQALKLSEHVYLLGRPNKDGGYHVTEKGATAYFEEEFLIRGEGLQLRRYQFWISIVAIVFSLFALIVSVIKLVRD